MHLCGMGCWQLSSQIIEIADYRAHVLGMPHTRSLLVSSLCDTTLHFIIITQSNHWSDENGVSNTILETSGLPKP